MSNDFYRAFEDKMRGSRALIKSRQRVYLPFIEPLLSLYKDAQAIDLGCGRGEWLELLKESGFNGYGVDLDDGMLIACRERGLNVATQDALTALKALPDESQTIVSGFHIAEHIKFSELQLLVCESLRVLKPAGLLILETPNTENIAVGTVNFYLDPTHQNPIPAMLLSFLPEYYGFAAVKVLRLQEDEALKESSRASLIDVLWGVSPDYAVVAQKYADDSLIAISSSAFTKEYGLSLEALAVRFDQQGVQVNDLIASAQAKAQHVGERLNLVEVKIDRVEVKAQQAEVKAQQAEVKAQQAEVKAQQAEVKAQQAEVALIAIHTSSSWRITAPLRTLMELYLKLNSVTPVRLKLKFKQLLRHYAESAIGFVLSRPRIRNIIKNIFNSIPSLRQRLLHALVDSGVSLDPPPPAWKNKSDSIFELHAMTPRARQIYQDLSMELDRGRKAAV